MYTSGVNNARSTYVYDWRGSRSESLFGVFDTSISSLYSLVYSQYSVLSQLDLARSL